MTVEKEMKKIILICLLVLSGMHYGWADGISIATFTIGAGETKDVDIVLEDEANAYVLAQFNLYLPEGVELVYNDESSSYAYTSTHTGSAYIGVSQKTDKNGKSYYQFYLEDRMMNPLGAGTIFTVTLKATDMIATGEQTAYIRNIVLVDDMGGGPDIAELTCDVTCEIAVNVTALGYASFSWPRTLDFTDSGAQAFIVTEKGNGRVRMEEVTTVPAGTGVILKATEGVYHPQTTEDEGDDVSSNLLTGTATASYTVDADNVFVLSNLNDGQAGFYIADSGVTIAQYKAYLRLDDADDAKAEGLAFDFTPTGIDSFKCTVQGSEVYNLNGQRMESSKFKVQSSKLPKGVYIVNGRKVIVR